jgi:hypothetical protein
MPEISVKRQYVAIEGRNEITLLRLDELSPEPCKRHAVYKGIRYSYCMCRPCVDMYLERKRQRGVTVTMLPEGWSPLETSPHE